MLKARQSRAVLCRDRLLDAAASLVPRRGAGELTLDAVAERAGVSKGGPADARAAVIVNRPFAEGAMFKQVSGKALPDWAGELGCHSWAQFFLKWILGHPAITCAIPGTRNPRHIADNLAAAADPLPDDRLRKRMAAYFAKPA